MLYLFLAHTVEAFECWFNEFNGSGIVQKTQTFTWKESHQMTWKLFVGPGSLKQKRAKVIDQVLTGWSINPSSFSHFCSMFKWFSVWQFSAVLSSKCLASVHPILIMLQAKSADNEARLKKAVMWALLLGLNSLEGLPALAQDPLSEPQRLCDQGW